MRCVGIVIQGFGIVILGFGIVMKGCVSVYYVFSIVM